MVTFLVVIQAVAGILMTAVTVLRRFQSPESGLSKSGKIIFAGSALVLVASIAGAQILNERAAAGVQQASDKAIARLYGLLAERVMQTPQVTEPLPPPTASESIRILEPADGARVQSRHLIRGHVTDRSGELWLVVHPLETSSYWVQPRVSVGRRGDWSVQAYFGRSGSLDTNRVFEMLAVQDPATPLDDAAILDRWPASRSVSDVITVTRE